MWWKRFFASIKVWQVSLKFVLFMFVHIPTPSFHQHHYYRYYYDHHRWMCLTVCGCWNGKSGRNECECFCVIARVLFKVVYWDLNFVLGSFYRIFWKEKSLLSLCPFVCRLIPYASILLAGKKSFWWFESYQKLFSKSKVRIL